jgi:flagellar hook-associated protein 1 FlgK
MGFKTLNIGATALLTQKYALDITGQNIANASTPGYSRQRVSTTAANPTVKSFGALGNGVEIASIKRIADEFLEKQVRLAYSTDQRLGTLQDGYENMEVFFNELSENDISTAMDNFWNSVSDFSNNVEDVSTRRSVIESAQTMADTFQAMNEKIRDYRTRQNEAIVDTVSDVNSMLDQVANLNKQIVVMESGGTTGVVANDLRDQRTQLLKELSGIMDVSVTEQSNGAVTVTQKSRILIYQNTTHHLSTKRVLSDDLLVDMPVFEGDNEEVIIGDGVLRAQIDIRDNVMKGYKEDIDQLSASFMWEFNRIHSQGVGLKGFSSLSGNNSVLDPSETLDNLAYDFTPEPGTFEIKNGNFEIVLHDETSDEESRLNIEIDLDGNGANPDTILYDPLNPNASNALVNKMQAAFDSVGTGLFTVSLDLANRIQITSNTSSYTFAFGRDTSGVTAALGLNTFFDGNNSGTITVNDALRNDPQLMAGGSMFESGNNEGALALLQLRDAKVLDNDSTTLDDYYEGIVGRLGIEAAQVDRLQETQSDILTRMENQREDLSGVNLDEELTKMIMYQRAFQSAARFISTADTIYETLINM